MNQKQKQKKLLIGLSVLVIILLLLWIAIQLFQKHQTEEQERLQQEETASQILTESRTYTSLNYYNQDHNLSFSLNPDSNQWIWTDHPDFPLDNSNITEILNTLNQLKPLQTITDGDTLESYGLDLQNPAAAITASDAQGQTLTLTLGNAAIDGTGYYMLLNQQESPVYLIDKTLYENIGKDIYDMYDLPDLPVLNQENLQSVTVKSPTGDSLFSIQKEENDTNQDHANPDNENQDDDANQDIRWISNGVDISDQENLKSLLDALPQLNIQSCYKFDPTEEDLSSCGFSQPISIEILYTDESQENQTLTVYLGNQDPEQSSWYLRLNTDPAIYQVSNSVIQSLLDAYNNQD